MVWGRQISPCSLGCKKAICWLQAYAKRTADPRVKPRVQEWRQLCKPQGGVFIASVAEPASEPKLLTAFTGSGFCGVNCAALGIARLSFLICKGGLLPWSSECFRGVVPTTSGFKKKCRIPVLRLGTVNRTSHSEPADPTGPLSWTPRDLEQGGTCIPGL